MTVKLFFAWYDQWVGAYWDRERKVLYLLPVPMLGIRISWGQPMKEKARLGASDRAGPNSDPARDG